MTQGDCARIDSLKFAQGRQLLSGAMPVSAYKRLMTGLHDSSGQLKYEVRGDSDQRNRPLLRLKISGKVRLQCQRCLGGMDHIVLIDTAVRLVAPEALDSEYDDDPDELDCVAASAVLDWVDLIEEEVLLALPPYPRHEAAQCVESADDANDRPEAESAGAGNKAFSVLQTLKQKVNQSKE